MPSPMTICAALFIYDWVDSHIVILKVRCLTWVPLLSYMSIIKVYDQSAPQHPCRSLSYLYSQLPEHCALASILLAVMEEKNDPLWPMWYFLPTWKFLYHLAYYITDFLTKYCRSLKYSSTDSIPCRPMLRSHSGKVTKLTLHKGISILTNFFSWLFFFFQEAKWMENSDYE